MSFMKYINHLPYLEELKRLQSAPGHQVKGVYRVLLLMQNGAFFRYEVKNCSDHENALLLALEDHHAAGRESTREVLYNVYGHCQEAGCNCGGTMELYDGLYVSRKPAAQGNAAEPCKTTVQ